MMTGERPTVLIQGAGVSGLVTAVTLAERGAVVTLVEAGPRIGSGASWFAGGMLAPWCEAEAAPAEVTRDSRDSLDWWAGHVPSVVSNGSLVVAPPRDLPELARFGRRTSHYETLDPAAIAALEPDLAGRFDRALFFPREGHVDPRRALTHLEALLEAQGAMVRIGCPAPDPRDTQEYDWTVDCTGMDGRADEPSLRGVRGEMILVRCPEVTLSRPVRMLHPRIPIYIVPREDSLFMAGATMVESEDTRGITVRAMSELLNALYTLHPAFAEAEIVETNAGIRPAYPDNVPRVHREGKRITLNGMYRHGFLLSPARAKEVAHIVFGG